MEIESLENEYKRLVEYMNDYMSGKFDESDEIIDEVSARITEIENETGWESIK